MFLFLPIFPFNMSAQTFLPVYPATAIFAPSFLSISQGTHVPLVHYMYHIYTYFRILFSLSTSLTRFMKVQIESDFA